MLQIQKPVNVASQLLATLIDLRSLRVRLCLQVIEEKARKAALLKEQEELTHNKENLLERWNAGLKRLRAVKKEVVKCQGGSFAYLELSKKNNPDQPK